MDAFDLILILLVLVVAIPMSLKMNKKLLAEKPHCKPYAWGYFLGVGGLISGLALVALGLVGGGGFVAVVGGVLVLSSYFTIKRYKWALIVTTVLNFNIIVWIANIFYIKNRWKELD